MTTLAKVFALSSGECRWIGREDIHCYCHAPIGQPARYQVVTADAETEWTDAATAVRQIESILAKESRYVA